MVRELVKKDKMKFIILVIFLITSIDYSYSQSYSISQIDSLNSFNSEFQNLFLNSETLNDTITPILIDTINFNLGKDNIATIVTYNYGRKNKVIGYFDNGRYFHESHFLLNEHTGPDIGWYKNGRMKSYCYYKNNEQISPLILWDENGSLSYITSDPKLDTFVGRSFQNWRLSQEEISLNEDSKNTFKEKVYYITGQLYLETIINKGKQKYEEFYENGKIKTNGYIFNAIWYPIDKWIEFYPNGKKKTEKNYGLTEQTAGQKNGKWYYWSKNGKLIKEEFYLNDELLNLKEYK